MALFNLSIYQLIWVFFAANVLKKLQPSRFYLKWITSKNIVCFRLPNDHELRKLASHEANKMTNKSSSGQASSASPKSKERDQFKIRASDLTKLKLDTVKMDSQVLWSAPYGEELEWVVDFACVSLISFLITQLVFRLSHDTINEYNFSSLWVLLAILQCTVILMQFTSIYFKSLNSTGERSICIISGSMFFLIAMVLMKFDERHLELGIIGASRSLSWSASDSLIEPDSAAEGQQFNLIALRIVLSVFCSIIGILFTFPGLRFGQLHEALLDTEVKLDRIIYGFNYLSPVLVLIMWIPSASRVPLKTKLFLDDKQFELLRFGLIVLVALIRLLLLPRYLRTFLTSAAARIDRLRFRGGTINSSEVQMTIIRINNYVNVVALQYLLPTLICLFASIMHLSLLSNSTDRIGLGEQRTNLRHLFGDQSCVIAAETFMTTVKTLIASDFLRNVFCFLSWWTHLALHGTTTAGVVYHKYFTQ